MTAPPPPWRPPSDADRLHDLARGEWSGWAFVGAVGLYLLAVSVGVAAIFIVLATPY